MTPLVKRAVELTRRHPIGTRCYYWPVLPPFAGEIPRSRVIRSPFCVLHDHTIVVWLEGEIGCVAAAHVIPLVDADPLPVELEGGVS